MKIMVPKYEEIIIMASNMEKPIRKASEWKEALIYDSGHCIKISAWKNGIEECERERERIGDDQQPTSQPTTSSLFFRR